jgi:peptide/nickel transport system substrate-binding protein
MRVTIAALALSAGAFAGCGERTPAPASGETGGTVLVALPGRQSTLLPALISYENEYAVADLVYERLATVPASLEIMHDVGFAPQLAQRWAWSDDSMRIAFTLDARARWHDGAPVRSVDVQRTFALYTDPRVESPTQPLLANIDSVSTPDDSTAVFWFKRRAPHQFLDATHHMLIMPAHRLVDADPADLASVPLARAPVGTGRFRFVAWRGDGRVEVQADTGNDRGRPFLDRVVFEIVTDAGAAAVKLVTGESDVAAQLTRDNIDQVARLPSLRVAQFPSLRYQLVTFNSRAPGSRTRPHPVLSDRAVRRALTLASNRERIVRTVFDSLGEPALGPIPRRALPDTTALQQLPFDPDAARALLDSAGWLPGPDGIRRRDGVRLAFEILAPSTSRPRERMAVLLQDQWRAVGADVKIQVLEVNALIDRISRRRFDAVANGWALTPGLVGLYQTWTPAGLAGDGNNWAGYDNPIVNASVDTILSTFDGAARDRAILRVAQTMIDDAPAVWLVEDRVVLGVHRRIELTTRSPLGWWRGLEEWRIAADARLDRDRIGLAPDR